MIISHTNVKGDYERGKKNQKCACEGKGVTKLVNNYVPFSHAPFSLVFLILSLLRVFLRNIFSWEDLKRWIIIIIL